MCDVIIRCPLLRLPERVYAIATILGDWLGLEHLVIPEDRLNTIIELGTGSSNAASLLLPDTFFQAADSRWLDPETLPSLPLRTFDTHSVDVPARVTDRHVPVLFGIDATTDPTSEPTNHQLPIDILGSTFFMLSRYEEAVIRARDEHDRFPADASVAYQAGFLERPIIDEYVEILWAAMKRLWPSLSRKQHQARVRVSCDVDHPFLIHGGPRRVLRRVGGDLIKRRSPRSALRTLTAWALARSRTHRFDEFRRNIDWMMDVNEDEGNTVAFNFIPEKTHPTMDNAPSLDEPPMRQLLRSIHERGVQTSACGLPASIPGTANLRRTRRHSAPTIRLPLPPAQADGRTPRNQGRTHTCSTASESTGTSMRLACAYFGQLRRSVPVTQPVASVQVDAVSYA